MGKHIFSIELKSKEYLKLVAIPNDVGDDVSIVGFLGELETVGLVEGVVLEIQGTNGSLKMELKEEELKRLCVCHQKQR
ncbi:MAG: hypothetical protein V1850_03245 [Candidatus Bathyarchaeota archaeon]